MDCAKVGGLILRLRREQGLTQQQLADALGLSNKTISKWERGLGCPDISLLGALSQVLGVNIEQILAGDLSPNPSDGGNMKKLQFYYCPTCGNLLTASAGGEISCCGRKLAPMPVQPADAAHTPTVEQVEDEWYLTFDHPMEKGHFLAFAALVGYDRAQLVRLYPEGNAALRLPRVGRGAVYVGCSTHGLFLLKLPE